MIELVLYLLSYTTVGVGLLIWVMALFGFFDQTLLAIGVSFAAVAAGLALGLVVTGFVPE